MPTVYAVRPDVQRPVEFKLHHYLKLDCLGPECDLPGAERHGLEWHGWHAFRRGLATNLHQLGVQDKVFQRILRHSNVAVTQACYIKTADIDVLAAMNRLSDRTGETGHESAF